MTETLLKGGILVNSEGMKRADIYIKDGLVDSVECGDSDRTAERVIDASGKYVIPGIIDAHIHPVYADRINTLSRAAASEGITTLIPYVGAVKAWGETGALEDAIDDFINEGEKTSVVDFGIHCTLLQDDIENAESVIPKLVHKGIISFKAFMAYAKRGMKLEDHELLHIMKIVAANKAILAAHAENGTIIDYLETELVARGRQMPEDYPSSQPGLCEAEAVFRFLTLGRVTKCSLYIPHISARESLEVVKLFKGWGEPEFFVETCPHYLIFTEEELKKRGSIAKMAPPLRKERDINEMWIAVQEGLIDVIASDAAGHMIKSNAPLWDEIFKAPNGIPGLDTLFKVVYNEGVNKGRMTFPRLVEQLCENPAKIFGLYPNKGVIKEGSDADIVIFDPSVSQTIGKKHPELKVDYSMYEGRRCLGAPVFVMQRGKTIFENGELKAEPGQGQFVAGKRRV